MDTVATFDLKWSPGHKRAFPTNPLAHALCELLGVKTMPLHRVPVIRKLGFTVDITDLTAS